MVKNSRNSRGAEGNTKPQPAKQDSTAIRWCFTHNFEIEEDIKSEEALINEIVVKLKNISKYYIFSLEKGGEKLRRHLQGYVEFDKPQRLSSVKHIIENSTHWEKSKGGRQDNYMYITKEPIKGPFEYDKKTAPKYTAEELGLITFDNLYPWQLQIIDMINKKPEKRKIYWYWSKMGGIGKTEFTKYLMYHHNAKFCQGSKKDIMCNILGKDGTTDIRNIYIFGYPRTVEGMVSYDALESVKDGLLFSSKYESNDAIIPIPHILVFSNFKPDTTKMSEDRWIITNLDLQLSISDEIDKLDDELKELENIKPSKFSINFDD